MSKIHLNDEFGEIDNNIKALNDRFVMVPKIYANQLKENKIPFYWWNDRSIATNKYIVTRGKKPKKFNAEQVQEIRDRYAKGGISINKLACQYKACKSTMQKILNGSY